MLSDWAKVVSVIFFSLRLSDICQKSKIRNNADIHDTICFKIRNTVIQSLTLSIPVRSLTYRRCTFVENVLLCTSAQQCIVRHLWSRGRSAPLSSSDSNTLQLPWNQVQSQSNIGGRSDGAIKMRDPENAGLITSRIKEQNAVAIRKMPDWKSGTGNCMAGKGKIKMQW